MLRARCRERCGTWRISLPPSRSSSASTSAFPARRARSAGESDRRESIPRLVRARLDRGPHLADPRVRHCAVHSNVGPADRARSARAAADADRGRVRRGRNFDARVPLPPAWNRNSHAECRCAASRASRGIRSCGALRSGRSCISSSTATWLQRSCSARCSCSLSSALRRSMRSVATLTARAGNTSRARLPTFRSQRSCSDAIISWPALREIGIVRPLIAIAVFIALFLLHGRLFGAPLT